MQFTLTLDKDFENLLSNIERDYGRNMLKFNGLDKDQLDIVNFYKTFSSGLSVASLSTDDNSNVSSKNVAIMRSESKKPIDRLISKNKIYIEYKESFGKDYADLFFKRMMVGAIYEHDDYSSSMLPYCFAFSLFPIYEKGLFFIKEMNTKAPQHWDTFNHFTLEFINLATNSLAGAVGTVDYLVYAFYFFKKDCEEKGFTGKQRDKFRTQKFQEFIYNLNQPYLKNSEQSAYTNISILDREHLIGFFHDLEFKDGTMFIDQIDEFVDFQNEFMEYAGQLRKEKHYTFPVLSASLLFDDEIQDYVDQKIATQVINHNFKYGFYDINIMQPREVTGVASCCRLVNDSKAIKKGKEELQEELKGNFNSIGGTSLSLGSTKVCTINLAHIALEHKQTGRPFEEILEETVDLIHKYHYAQRNCLKKLINKGLLPLYTHGLMSLDRQFATVGLTGVFECAKVMGCVERYVGGYRYTQEGLTTVGNWLNKIVEMNKTTLKEHGYTSNVEQVPSESASIKLRNKDRLYFGEELFDEYLPNCKLYGNQWIPLNIECQVKDRLDASVLDKNCGGGVMLHLNLGEPFKSFEDCYNYCKFVASCGAVYFSFIAKINVCQHDHSFFTDTCPICNEPYTDQVIKVVGYMTKRSSFHEVRAEEMDNRIMYDEHQYSGQLLE